MIAQEKIELLRYKTKSSSLAMTAIETDTLNLILEERERLLSALANSSPNVAFGGTKEKPIVRFLCCASEQHTPDCIWTAARRLFSGLSGIDE